MCFFVRMWLVLGCRKKWMLHNPTEANHSSATVTASHIRSTVVEWFLFDLITAYVSGYVFSYWTQTLPFACFVPKMYHSWLYRSRPFDNVVGWSQGNCMVPCVTRTDCQQCLQPGSSCTWIANSTTGNGVTATPTAGIIRCLLLSFIS